MWAVGSLRLEGRGRRDPPLFHRRETGCGAGADGGGFFPNVLRTLWLLIPTNQCYCLVLFPLAREEGGGRESTGAEAMNLLLGTSVKCCIHLAPRLNQMP